MKKLMWVLFFILIPFSCLKIPTGTDELPDWYVTLRLPIGDTSITAAEAFRNRPDKYEVGRDSLFLLQRHVESKNVPPTGALFTATLERFLPENIDTANSEFSSILFIMFGGVRFKGQVTDTTSGYIVFTPFKWNNSTKQFEYYLPLPDTSRIVPFVFAPTSSIDTMLRVFFPDFPMGPHRLKITPVVTSGKASFDTVDAQKRVLFGANLTGDIVVTIYDTVKNKDADLRKAAKQKRIKRVKVVLHVIHSIPARVFGVCSLQSLIPDTTVHIVIDSVEIQAAPKDSLGLSTNYVEFDIVKTLEQPHFRILEDSLIFWKIRAIADSQGNAYLKPEDSLRVFGYIEATVLNNWDFGF